MSSRDADRALAEQRGAAAAAAAAPRRVPRPKRPLSAFNLFYRFKRQHVLDASTAGQPSKEDVEALVARPPGLEGADDAETENLSDEEVNELRRANIRAALEDNLAPRDTRDRRHRQTTAGVSGAFSFVELGKLMNAAWKECDEFAKTVFGELAEEGREVYHQKMREYHAASRQYDLMEYGKAIEEEESEEERPKKKKARKPKKQKRGSSASQASTASAAAASMTNQLGEPSYDAMQARMRDLEGQLAEHRLRLRVQELEEALVRQRVVEDRLRAQVAMLMDGQGSMGMGMGQRMMGGMGGMGGGEFGASSLPFPMDTGMNRMNMNMNMNMGNAGMSGGMMNPSNVGTMGGPRGGSGLWDLVSAARESREDDEGRSGKEPGQKKSEV